MTPPLYFIGLNGPPGVGKDMLSEAIFKDIELAKAFLVHRMKYADPLKNAVHALLGGAYIEENKSKPSPFGPTWRELYIGMSELYAKPLCGPQIFGDLMVERIKDSIKSTSRPTLFVCSDCGFEPEQIPVIEYLGAANCLYWNIHREGHSFAADSRGYIRPPGVITLEHWNVQATAAEAGETFVDQLKEVLRTRGWM